ncbi:hypothetical protein [Micromonospora sp. NPDC048843]|uniref:hypothetical protein n=1 Tax=Micromonospora sp. NPDC048843 TaxID=3155389 RepID=UPI0033F5DC35
MDVPVETLVVPPQPPNLSLIRARPRPHAGLHTGVRVRAHPFATEDREVARRHGGCASDPQVLGGGHGRPPVDRVGGTPARHAEGRRDLAHSAARGIRDE